MIDMEKFPALKSLNRFIITFFFVMGVTFNMVAPFSIVDADYTVGTIITGEQDYGHGSIDLGNNEIYGVRWNLGTSTNGYTWYAYPYVSISGGTQYRIFDDYICFRSGSYSVYSGDQYENLYDLGDISDKYSSGNSSDYALGYFTGNDFDISNLTKVETGSSILSWTTGSNPYTITANNDIYILGTRGGYVFYFSLQPDTIVTCERSNTLTFNLNNYITYGDTTVYYYSSSNWSYSSSYVYGFNWDNNTVPNPFVYAGIVAFQGSGSGTGIDYGDIKDLSYSTNIVGSGTTTGDANIDTISWYPYWDTNDNISTTWNMEIQVVPGTWQGGTATDIFSQSYKDFIINDSGAMSIYHGTYLNGSYSISWGEVKNKLSILSWADLFQYFDGSYWNKKGWVYRARFQDPDSGYWSEWQTVYTVTSSSGEGVEEFIDPSDGTGLPDFYNNAVNSYNTTSIVNNNNNVTYYYVNTPIDTNPSSDDSTQYLKEIRDTIIQIRKMIAIDNNSDTNINNDNDPWHGNPAAELYDFEDNSINDFNDAVGNLPTSDLVTGNKFLAASNWVRTQYETIVSNTPFEAVIVFSLLIGFGLLLIGKLR